jgi:hypothetical protein
VELGIRIDSTARRRRRSSIEAVAWSLARAYRDAIECAAVTDGLDLPPFLVLTATRPAPSAELSSDAPASC